MVVIFFTIRTRENRSALLLARPDGSPVPRRVCRFRLREPFPRSGLAPNLLLLYLVYVLVFNGPHGFIQILG